MFFLLIIFRSITTKDQVTLGKIFFFVFGVISLVIVHIYWLIPIAKRKRGTWFFGGMLLISLGIYVLLQQTIIQEIFHLYYKMFCIWSLGRAYNGIWLSVMTFMVVSFFSSFYRLYIDHSKQRRLIKDLRRINLEAELNFLRCQISPHFMLNLVNTLVAMARGGSSAVERSLIGLGGMMQYTLYENGPIRLDKEIEYLKDYINLQLLRFGDIINFNLFLSGPFENYLLEPMLLIPFVENAFKHGTGQKMESVMESIIDVSVYIDESQNILHMTVMNTVDNRPGKKGSNNGIGLANVERRLTLLYPEKHEIILTEKDHYYIVNLEISL